MRAWYFLLLAVLALVVCSLGACTGAETIAHLTPTPSRILPTSTSVLSTSPPSPILPTSTLVPATSTAESPMDTVEPRATALPLTNPMPFPWPLPMPTEPQVEEALGCDVELFADERYANVATDGLLNSYEVVSPCDWAVLAAAYVLRSETDDSLLEPGQIAWASAVSQNPAYAFASPLFLSYVETAAALEPPPFSQEPLTRVTLRYDWTGYGSDPVEFNVSIENAETDPEVVGRVDGQEYSSGLDAELVRALGQSVTGLIPVDAAADSKALVVCTDNYPDWEAVLTYRSGDTVQMATHGSNVFDFGGPWWVTFEDQLYLQPSPSFVIALYDIVSALDLPVGVAAGMYCTGLESDLLEIMYPD